MDREQRKADLAASAESYLANIQNQLGDLRKVGTNALVIGGVVLAGYLLTNLIFSEQRTEETTTEPEEKESDSLILSGLKGIATAVLLSIAREKIVQLIEHLTQEDASNPT